ncbi:recombinase family protein [Escherichia coli]|uniref:recombinase family protein n=1 Tax=Escherichia coli TaxID=562 RepID=UPI0022E6FA4E|nr:recombinase family protein [Escherichia coli]
MRREKTKSFNVRLPVSLLARIESEALRKGLSRSDIVIEALNGAMGMEQGGVDTKLLTAIEALRSEVRALGNGRYDARQYVQRKEMEDVKQVAQQSAQQIAPRGADPRFQAVSDEVDQLIVSMTAENATLPAIASALNAAGHRTATGKEWNTSRVRDYRQKLRERGLV